MGDPEDCVMDGAARACDRWGVAKSRSFGSAYSPHKRRPVCGDPAYPTDDESSAGPRAAPLRMTHREGEGSLAAIGGGVASR